ncbi:glutathione S-transferase [Fusarium tjaetaba]|uniref:Glutathione S-transferase n=1 Tax=Fusarium tjaetaba TaxID=1567544 RepID=A0A8H5VEI8_9HYPO|nr:glutathione S-transferase [Fusarium tjaetaba]KAF5620581.1 glutathione S-transferase [Fusarium tjaetaba]
MSLKLYYKTYSTADLTVAVLAELEHGLSEPIAERIEVDLQKGESRTPEYLKGVNPNGLVPAIVHDGVSIWEASAITMYLGETFGVERPPNNKEAPVLYPPPGTSRGKAMTWIVWSSTELGKKGIALGESQASKSKAQLDKADYILGDWYSIVDTHLWATLRWLTYMGLDLAAFPALAAWKKKIEQRPAIQRLQQQ